MGSAKITKRYNVSDLKGGFWVKTKNIDEIKYMLKKWLSLYGNTSVCIGTSMDNNYTVIELLNGELEDIDYRGMCFGSLTESCNMGKGNFQFLNAEQRNKQLGEYIEAHNKYNPGSLTDDFKDISIVEGWDISEGREDVEDICLSFKDFEMAFMYFLDGPDAKRDNKINKILV